MIDFYSLGALLFEMLTGLPPLFDEDRTKLYDKLLTEEPEIPESLNEDARDLLDKILRKDPNERIGAERGAEEIMEHPFCASVDFEALERKELKPNFCPVSMTDTNFDFEETILPIEFEGEWGEYQFEELDFSKAYNPEDEVP